MCIISKIIDEADTGIYDILFNNLILSAKDCIKGQLTIRRIIQHC
jgi:hypothetical protein